MVSVRPQGNVYLCKTPLESDYKNQLTFSNQNAQQSYFNSTIAKSYSNYVYVRKDGYITIDECIDAIRDCNYLFYRNTGFSNRIYYCFIKRMEYVSENSTRIYFDTDCFQTWYFDLQFKPCFIEREHVNDDAFGKHTLPENLETGEFVNNKTYKLGVGASPVISGSQDTPHETLICFQVTKLEINAENLSSRNLNMYNKIFSGLKIFAVNNVRDAKAVIEAYDQAAAGDAIVSIFHAYGKLFDAGFSGTAGDKNILVYAPSVTYEDSSAVPLANVYNISVPSSLNGYTPKNKKVLTGQFNFLQASNMAGSTANYYFELFRDPSSIEFINFGTLSQGCSSKMLPIGYMSSTEATPYDNTINAGKLPVCAWASDYYTNWVTQQGVNVAVTPVLEGVSSGISAGIYSGGNAAIAGAVGATAGLTSTWRSIQKTYEASLVPPEAKGNVNSSDLNFSNDKIGFEIYNKCIRAEYARIIDNFFSMYGYKVNIVKTPNITGRQNWNFVKTIDCNIEGNIPQEDLQTIRSMFDSGCTFWHNASNMYNYNLSNSIV